MVRGDLFAGIICFAVSRIYDQFSHGVHSAYMDMFFLVPLFCGIVLAACFLAVPVRGIQDRKLRKLSGICRHLLPDEWQQKKTGFRSIHSRSYADGRTVADLSMLFFSCRLSAASSCVGMFLNGVLKIAGTGSVLPQFLMFAGSLLFPAGILRFLFIHTAVR